jgi:homoaconitase/3-isopropylmalate dehydratase large subunit
MGGARNSGIANGQTQLLIGTHLIHEVTSPQVFASLRNIRSGCLSWKQVTESVSPIWDQEWQTLSTAHGNAARSVTLHVARLYSDRTLRELAQLAGGMGYPSRLRPFDAWSDD